MISQFFILSPRGDTIISRFLRGDVPKDTPPIFFRKVKFWNGSKQDAPPIFFLDGVSYMYIKHDGLYFMCTSRMNISPSLVSELLVSICRIFKDYCGILNEESIRKNFVLIYELLDEVLDFGYPQSTSSDTLKAFIYNKPNVELKEKLLSKMKFEINPKSTPSSSVQKPIAADGKHRNEVFVDIFERINMTFNSNGYATQSEIDGTIQLKSYLASNPELRLALNEELVIGPSTSNSYGIVALDDCNFHECVRMNAFETSRVLAFRPPDGEFSLMNYRVTNQFRAPFRVFPFVDIISPYKVEVIIKVRADFPQENYGNNVKVTLPVPKQTSSVSWEWGAVQSSGKLGKHPYSGHQVDYIEKTRQIVWSIKKFSGSKEFSIRCKLVLTSSIGAKKEIGPVSMAFEIPMYNVSNLQVRYLRILETSKKYNPYRWVRYITKSSSYVCRI